MSPPPEFASRDSVAADFWDERFAAGFTPWDAGGVPPVLQRWIATASAGRILIPGCGAGYEVGAFDAAGFDVIAIDYAAEAIARARATLGAERAQRLLRQADFFTFEAPPFDWVYERAFVIALPPKIWSAWAARVAALTVPGGCLIGFFLLEAAIPEPRRGPPFAMTRPELDALLQSHFDCIAQAPVAESESIPVFAGREHFMVWRRR